MIEARDGGVRIRVRVQPRASRTEVAGAYGDAVRVRLTAPPVEGAANEELVRFMAKRLGVRQAAVRIVSGESARSKLIDVDGIGESAARAALLE